MAITILVMKIIKKNNSIEYNTLKKLKTNQFKYTLHDV